MRQLTVVCLTILSIFPSQVVLSQDISTNISTTESDCYFSLRWQVFGKNTGEVVTETTISQDYMATPSLWWSKELLDPFAGKLIKNWLAYSAEKRIDLIVDWQLWRSLDYLQRYSFVNNFGMVAREYGYGLQIFNQENQCLATYNYNELNNKWEISFDPSVQNSWQIERKQK